MKSTSWKELKVLAIYICSMPRINFRKSPFKAAFRSNSAQGKANKRINEEIEWGEV